MKGIITFFLLIACCMMYIEKDKAEEEVKKLKYEKLSVPDPVGGDYSNIKSWNFEEQTWETYKHPYNLSDEEIRMLREKQSYKSNSTYIYTPGRHVKTREQEIEEYIEDNIDDILDEYQN